MDIALVAAMALGTYFWAVRAGARAHHAGLPGPDPILDPTLDPALEADTSSARGDVPAPEREPAPA
ncbi:hypothetical protein ACFXD5_26450 [Streptomyces sp. NPDC059385]|uniref:hypothetical protein n=1 Tax=Streptomyces sp. NPDC059385 TaxID=3346817 RepID=UPI00369679B7